MSLKAYLILPMQVLPSFDANRLTNLDFERVDATRLYRLYKQKGSLRLGVDITSWLVNENKDTLTAAL
jgi:hypothetical protein